MQLDDVGMVLQTVRISMGQQWRVTYQLAQNVDLIDESLVVLYTSLLNYLDGKLLIRSPVLRQVHLSEGSISQFLLEVIDLLDLALVSISKHILWSFLFLSFDHKFLVYTQKLI